MYSKKIFGSRRRAISLRSETEAARINAFSTAPGVLEPGAAVRKAQFVDTSAVACAASGGRGAMMIQT